MNTRNDENREYCKSIADKLEAIAEGTLYICPECGEMLHESDFTYSEEDGTYTCSHCGAVIDEGDFYPAGMCDYFNNIFDLEYIIGSDMEYRSARIMVACGGPNVFVNTKNGRVELFWWTESAYYDLDRDTVIAIDDFFSELYECNRH